MRLIGSDGEQVGIVSMAEALSTAESQELDLVEISPNADPIVCRIMDYGKYLYDKSKKQHQARKHHKRIQVKEIKFRPTTEEGDYQIKLRKLREFLEVGNKVKITVRFRGREMAHRDIGMELLRRLQQDLLEIGQVEQMPKMEGRQMVMVVAPRQQQK